MSPTPNVPKRLLSINTAVPTLELYLIDSQNNVTARGVRSLEVELPVGIYKVRFRIGNTVADRIIELPVGSGAFAPAQGDLPEIPIASPVPLGKSPAASLASEWNGTTNINHGTGSRIFIFVNGVISPSTVTLRTFEGIEIASLAQGASGEGCFGCSIEVDPGDYVLRVDHEDSQAFCQSIHTVVGWQTQIFLPVAQRKDSNAADLSGGSMLMSPIESGFQPESDDSLWADAARKSLAAGRWAISLPDGFPPDGSLNPMLGIYAAHILALQGDPQNAGQVRAIAVRLQQLVGNHPDVTSLLLYLNDPAASALSFLFPPMLVSSWSMIVKQSTEHSNLVPAGSYSAKIAGSVWGSGAWLEWKASDEPVAEAGEAPTEVDWDVLKRAAAGTASAAPHADLTPVERAVMSYVAQGTKHFTLLPEAGRLFSFDREAQAVAPSAITEATGIPYSVILDAAASLTKKLK